MTNDSPEQWKPVTGFEGSYEVSDRGRVRSIDRFITTKRDQRRFMKGRILKPCNDNRGYMYVCLTKPGMKPKPHRIHRLVAEAFFGGALPNFEVCHNDGDRSNNHVWNLRWDTRSGNHRDKRIHGTDHLGSRTHCKYGHEYTATNTIVYSSNPGQMARRCRLCSRDRWARIRAEREAMGLKVERRPWKDAQL